MESKILKHSGFTLMICHEHIVDKNFSGIIQKVVFSFLTLSGMNGYTFYLRNKL